MTTTIGKLYQSWKFETIIRWCYWKTQFTLDNRQVEIVLQSCANFLLASGMWIVCGTRNRIGFGYDVCLFFCLLIFDRKKLLHEVISGSKCPIPCSILNKIKNISKPCRLYVTGYYCDIIVISFTPIE